MSPTPSDSDRYNPTTADPLGDLTKRTQKASGYVCPQCGFLTPEEDELLGLTCPKCLQEFIKASGVPQLIPVQQHTEEHDSALVPSIKIPKPQKPSYEQTTRIVSVTEMSQKPKTVIQLCDEQIPKKTKGIMDSDFNIPGL